MPFDVRAVFAGLCAYVPSSLLGDAGHPRRMTVLMPEARRSDFFLPDETQLAPHAPVLVLKARDIGAMAGGGEAKVVIDLARQWLTFEVEGPAATRPLEVVQNGPVDDPQDARDFSWGLEMSEIAPGYQQVHPRALERAGSRGLVAARVTLDKGSLSTHALNEAGAWRFEPNGPPLAEPLTLANQSALEIAGVERLTLVLRSLEDDSVTARIPVGGTGGRVDVTIGNLCADDLHEAVSGIEIEGDMLEDEDFRWYYQLADPDVTAAELMTLPRPVPDPGGGLGWRCMRVTFTVDPAA
jgi:hypothetical protein